MDPITVKIENLFLDPNNYRLRSNPKYIHVDSKSFTKPAIQKRTFFTFVGFERVNGLCWCCVKQCGKANTPTNE